MASGSTRGWTSWRFTSTSFRRRRWAGRSRSGTASRSFRRSPEALTLGGEALAADAVLSIGEHGEYPVNARGQREYPRKRFFDEIVAVFRKSGRVVPVFNDKHLSYRWDWAKEMYDTARQMGIPLMAGSSVPLAERRPPMEIPGGANIVDAISIHGGPLEAYDFHGLEVLQSIVEARQGGETGISSVRFVEGDALWEAAEAGLWNPKLADAAMAAELGPGAVPIRELVKTESFHTAPPHALLLTYRDGLRAAVLRVGNSGTRWNFACMTKDDPAPTRPGFTQARGIIATFSRRSATRSRPTSVTAAPPIRSSGPCSRPGRSTPR